MPLARPTTVAVAVLTFVLYWSDFMSPLLYLKSESATRCRSACECCSSWTRPTGRC